MILYLEMKYEEFDREVITRSFNGGWEMRI